MIEKIKKKIKKIKKINKKLKVYYRLRLEQKYKKLESKLYVVPMDYEDEKIFIYARSGFEREIRTVPCLKEPDTIEWIHTLMKPNEIIFDIGANIGNYSLIMASRLNKQAQIYAFEPAWFNFMQLTSNVELNNFDSCIFPIYAAFSSQTKIDWLYYSGSEYGSSMHNLGKPTRLRDQDFIPVKRMLVNSFTIDKFVEELAIVPNHIKIDVDGIESEIISGATETLKRPCLRSILVELNPDNHQDQRAIDQIINSGFKIWNIQQKPLTKELNYANQSNYIFVRSTENNKNFENRQ